MTDIKYPILEKKETSAQPTPILPDAIQSSPHVSHFYHDRAPVLLQGELMQHEPLSSLRDLRLARSLSQSEVAEAIGTNANTVSRWERGIAIPSPFYRRKLAELFDLDPQALFLDLNQEIAAKPSDKLQTLLTASDASRETIEISPSEPEMAKGPLVVEQGKPILPNDPLRPPFKDKIPRWVYILIASIMIFMLVLGGVIIVPSLLPKPSTSLFPALCSGNFQSTNASIVPTPTTGTSSDGEVIGLSEGTAIFDLQRRNPQEVQDKLQAAWDWLNNPQDVETSLKNAHSIDQTDAEAQIYRENWRVLGSNHPHITFVVGVSFEPNSDGASDGILQGAFIAQKDCNTYNEQDDSKTQIVLMIANIGGNNSDDRASSAKFVADQIADQAAKDPTIVAIVSWPTSSDSINVNNQLKIRGSHLSMVSPSASSDDLGGMSYFFRVCPLDRDQTKIAADFLLNKMHKKRISILYDQTTAYTNDMKYDFSTIMQKNIVVSASFNGGNTGTIQDALTNILAQHPDAIFFSGYANDLFDLLKDIPPTVLNQNLLIVGGDALSATNSYPNHLPDLQNIYFTSFASPNEWDSQKSKPPFFQEYKDNFGTLTAPNGLSSIDAHAMLGYDALSTLLYSSQQALSNHNNTITPSYIEDELKQITVTNPLQGITGRIAFDTNGNQNQSKMILVEHIAGKSLVIDKRYGCQQVTDNCRS